MNDALNFISNSAEQLCMEALELDERYCRLKRERHDLWARLRERYSPEVCDAILDMVDAENLVRAMEADRLFFMGLQMGLELGGLDVFPAG